VVQIAVKRLRDIGGQLTDELNAHQLAAATSHIDALTHPLSRDDIESLLLLLPDNGDTASGLNWNVLHAIEASPVWPLWDTLKNDRSEWVQILRRRLANTGVQPPAHKGRSPISRLVRRCIIGFALVFATQALFLQMSGRKVLISSGLERVYIFEGDLVSDIPPRNEQEAARTTEAVWRWCRYWTGLRVKHFPLPGREQCFIITP